MARLASALLLAQTLLLSCLVDAQQKPQALGTRRSFYTVPSTMQIPVVQSTKYGQTEPGYMFINVLNRTAPWITPMILTDDGDLVWYSTEISFGPLRPQTYQNKTVLTTWIGTTNPEGLGWGQVNMFDDTYTLIKNVTLQPPNFQTFDHTKYSSYVDVHESQMTTDGSMLVIAVNITTANMSSVGGPGHGYVIDGQFYEIDVATNKVLFSWSALNHSSEIPLDDSVLPLTTSISGNGTSFEEPWGYFHMNSVAKYGSNYLISVRLLCSIFLIGPQGNVIWRLSVSFASPFVYSREQDLQKHTVQLGLMFSCREWTEVTSDSGRTPTSATNTTLAFSIKTPTR